VRAFTICVLIASFALFGWLLSQVELAAVARSMGQLGWLGALTIVALFAIGFQADVFSWHLTFQSIAVSARWTLRLWLVNMVGEALNIVAPFGSLGGEPFKALLLNRHYAVSYRDGTASLLLIQTINSLAQIPLVVVGVALMFRRGILSPALETIVSIACVLLVLFMGLVLAALHLRWLSHLLGLLEKGRWGPRLSAVLQALKAIEEQLAVFVRHHPTRFSVALLFAFGNWLCGAIELFLILHFLGRPIGFADCWLIEAVVVLVRSSTFFVPGHIGVQDGAITLMCGLLTGSADVGFAVALIRRARELFWSFLGLVIGGWFSLRGPKAAIEPASISSDQAHGLKGRYNALKLLAGHAGEHGQADMAAARHQGGTEIAGIKIVKDRA
jgi:uncharacterized protein (TIRG00374 family)